MAASPLEAGAVFSDLVAELYYRGYDHLNQDAAGRIRAKRWVNQSYIELVEEEKWSFRLSTAAGASPLTITDMGEVLSVIDTGNSSRRLQEMTEDELAGYILSTTGLPTFYYLDNLQVKTWPVGGTISVRYYATPPYLVADSDTTTVPARYMDAIVNGAVRRAAADRDNPEAVALAEAERQRTLAAMRIRLLPMPTHVPYYGESLDD